MCHIWGLACSPAELQDRQGQGHQGVPLQVSLTLSTLQLKYVKITGQCMIFMSMFDFWNVCLHTGLCVIDDSDKAHCWQCLHYIIENTPYFHHREALDMYDKKNQTLY